MTLPAFRLAFAIFILLAAFCAFIPSAIALRWVQGPQHSVPANLHGNETPKPRRVGADTGRHLETSQLTKSHGRTVGPRFDSGQVHYGPEQVSTAGGYVMETAEKHSRKTEQNHKRQLRVADGGLTASRGNVDRASSPNGGPTQALTDEYACSNRSANTGSARFTVIVTDYRQMARVAARKCRVPSALFLRQVARESSFDPLALSPSGAVGLGQLLPRYHAHPLLDLWDPETNLNLSACYLRRHFDRLRVLSISEPQAWRMALEAYHAGENRKRTSPTTLAYARAIQGAER